MLDVTRKSACDILMKGVHTTLSPEEVETISWAISNDVVVRDFMMTMPAFFKMEEVLKYLEILEANPAMTAVAPINSVLSLLYYETDNPESFARSMGKAISANPEYALTKMIARIVISGWPQVAFEKMRNELKEKVIHSCYGEHATFLIEENNG